MPKENRKLISVDNIRHSEYYGLQETFDRLYAQSKNGEIFTNLMEIILSRENILLAYLREQIGKLSEILGDLHQKRS